MHVGSSSLTRDRTRAPCIGSTESYPLDHQGSPRDFFFNVHVWAPPLEILIQLVWVETPILAAYRLNVCAHPKFMLKPNPQGAGIWQWNLWEVIKS